MKTLFLIALLLLSTSARGNLYVPDAKLAGETVHVRLLKDSAIVTAIFEFEEFFTRDAKLLHFPIFGESELSPVQVLANSGFELEVGDKKQIIATPCKAPERLGAIPKSPQVYWFSVTIDDLIEEQIVSPLVIKATYTQPRIQGSFHYLPIIVDISNDFRARSWKYQMFAHSGLKAPQVVSKNLDYEQFPDGVIVYLKDRQLVEIR